MDDLGARVKAALAAPIRMWSREADESIIRDLWARVRELPPEEATDSMVQAAMEHDFASYMKCAIIWRTMFLRWREDQRAGAAKTHDERENRSASNSMLGEDILHQPSNSTPNTGASLGKTSGAATGPPFAATSSDCVAHWPSPDGSGQTGPTLVERQGLIRHIDALLRGELLTAEHGTINDNLRDARAMLLSDADRIEQLERQRITSDELLDLATMRQENDRLRTELAEARKDAERYRLARIDFYGYNGATPEECDAHYDARIAAMLGEESK